MKKITSAHFGDAVAGHGAEGVNYMLRLFVESKKDDTLELETDSGKGIRLERKDGELFLVSEGY